MPAAERGDKQRQGVGSRWEIKGRMLASWSQVTDITDGVKRGESETCPGIEEKSGLVQDHRTGNPVHLHQDLGVSQGSMA